jgi:DNA-binding protein
MIFLKWVFPSLTKLSNASPGWFLCGYVVSVATMVVFDSDSIYKQRTTIMQLTFRAFGEKTQNVNHTMNKNRRMKNTTEKQQDVIFVGNKPPMSYVLAIITAFSSGNPKEITLKARGQAITTAVDVAEITRSRFLKELKVSSIAIGTAEMPPREGETRSRMVSTIEIALAKP